MSVYILVRRQPGYQWIVSKFSYDATDATCHCLRYFYRHAVHISRRCWNQKNLSDPWLAWLCHHIVSLRYSIIRSKYLYSGALLFLVYFTDELCQFLCPSLCCCDLVGHVGKTHVPENLHYRRCDHRHFPSALIWYAQFYIDYHGCHTLPLFCLACKNTFICWINFHSSYRPSHRLLSRYSVLSICWPSLY